MIRALVVEDSLTIRRHIVDVLANAGGFEVVGEAADGRAAIELCERERPDVVTMDMMLPILTGLEATEHIMAYCPTPIVIVSASTNRGELFRTYDALAAGAVDVLEKPTGVEIDAAWDRQLVDVVRTVSRIRVITHPRARLGRIGAARGAGATRVTVPASALNAAGSSSAELRAVAIGASTGGPAAVLEVLRALPKAFPVPILLVMHIAEPFAAALADWLDAQIELPVRYARHGERLPEGGCVLMAPPGTHLEIRGGRVELGDGPERHSCKPSVDVLFESLARELGARALACLLTGMGRDGALGLLAIRRAGGVTIAQDEATSVVFGMPGEAVRLAAAREVLPIDAIGPYVAAAADPRSRP